MNRKPLLIGLVGLLTVGLAVWLIVKPDKGEQYEYPEIPIEESVVLSSEESTEINDESTYVTNEELEKLEFEDLETGYNSQYQGDLNKELYTPKEMELTDNGIHYVRQNIETLGLSLLIPEGYEPIPEQSGGFIIFTDGTSNSVIPSQFAVAKFQSQRKEKENIQMDLRQKISTNYRYYTPGQMYELMTLRQLSSSELTEVIDEEVEILLDSEYPADRVQLIDESIGSPNLEKSHKLLRWTEQFQTDQLVSVGGTGFTAPITMFINYGVLENDATVVITSTKIDYPKEMEDINRVVAESVALMTDETSTLPVLNNTVESEHFTLDLPDGAELTQTSGNVNFYTFPNVDSLNPLSQIQIALYDYESMPDFPQAGDLMNAIPYVDAISKGLVLEEFSQLGQTSKIIQINPKDFGQINESGSEVVRYNAVHLARTVNVSDDDLGGFKYPLPISGELLSIYRNESGNVYGILVFGPNETADLQNEILNGIHRTLTYE